MSLIPSIELDGVSGLLVIGAVIGILLVWYYATAFLSFAIGSAAVLLLLVVAYYVLVRIDRLLRGGGARV